MRSFTRVAQEKQPIAESLVIAPVEERQAALKQGKMVFYDGRERIELPLIANAKVFLGRRVPGFLQGVFELSYVSGPGLAHEVFHHIF